MTPLIPPIIGASMLKLVVMLLQMFGVLSTESDTYIILNSIGDAAFYFLPIMVAASAAKKFHTNAYLLSPSPACCCTPIPYPDGSVTVGDTAAHSWASPSHRSSTPTRSSPRSA